MPSENDLSEGVVEPSAAAPMIRADEGRRVITLIPFHEQEPPATLSEAKSMAIWSAVSSVWHPRVLAKLHGVPTIESVDAPSSPLPGEVRVVPAGYLDRLPSGFRVQAEDAGTRIVEAFANRSETAQAVLMKLDDQADPKLPADDEVAADFQALGTARWWLRDLTIAMGHVDCLDLASLDREVISGAMVWATGDAIAARNRLRAAFELLTQARERFYPVDSYLLNVCLLDPSTPLADFLREIKEPMPVTFMASARAFEALGRQDPEGLAALPAAVDEGRVDVVGGTYDEVDEALRPLESALWQFAAGARVYRRWIDDRTTETIARRRFGLHAQLPQVARRFGFRFGLHWALDDGRFPSPLETKRMWESPDGSSVEALIRLPLAGDRAIEGLKLPWRIGQTMKDDTVATVSVAHWPEPVAGWFRDLRRVAAYSPVFMRWSTLSDYFHQTDRPFELLRPDNDQYETPYLQQAVARKSTAPVSARVEHARLRHRLDAVESLAALARMLGGGEEPTEPAAGSLADALERGELEGLASQLETREASVGRALADRVSLGAREEREAGFLVFNPIAVARRAVVTLVEASADLRPTGALRASQLTEEGVQAVVDLPALGYAWIARDTDHSLEPLAYGRDFQADGRTLRTDSVEVVVDEATGGLRALRAVGEPFNRLGQQLVVVGLTGQDGYPATSRMRVETFEVDYGGPALLQATSTGVLEDPLDDHTLARFRQRYRLWRGRPVLEVEITLSDLDPRWLERISRAGVDPWREALCCRWAWPDPEADMRRTCWLSSRPTRSQRPETAESIDLNTRNIRTSILFGGLAHHQRNGTRMLDTVLIAGAERERVFQVGLALDLEHSFHAIQDLLAPAVVVPTSAGVPLAGPAGWFGHLDHRGVAITRIEVQQETAEDRGPALVFHLLETAGKPSRCRLRLAVTPSWARQTDLNGELLVDLSTVDDTVLLDLTPRELARVEVGLA